MRKVLVLNDYEGFFHQWMNNSEGRPYAIVERLDGTIAWVDWRNLQFFTPPELLEQPVEVGGMTKEELIEKWKAKQIVVQNNDGIATMNVLNLLGGRKSDKCINLFYIFFDDEYKWECYDKADPRNLPTIKASEALSILTQPETIKTK